MSAALTVQNLRIGLAADTGKTQGINLVADINFSVAAGEVLALVGESGSGKTTIAMALLGHTRAGAVIEAGKVDTGGLDILALSENELRHVRGNIISLVAQNPAMALNPLRTIGQHLHDVLKAHQPELDLTGRSARIAAVMEDTGLPVAPEFLKRFPHQLSGGQQQRILLGLAFVLRPRVIVLDEPTTALDVSSQARILTTIRTLCQRYDTAAVYVSHDLAVVRQLADHVMVLYAGRIAEIAPRASLFARPRHPYSHGLLEAIPDIALRRAPSPIPGQAVGPAQRGAGCAFAPRCRHADNICHAQAPRLRVIQVAHHVERLVEHTDHVGNVPIDNAVQHQLACHHTDLGLVLSQPQHQQYGAQTQASSLPPVLYLHEISAHYGKQAVLHGVSLAVSMGECLAIVGQSGSGKTTLAKIMAGLDIAASGRINFNGHELPMRAAHRAAEQRHKIQYIFQNPYQALNPRHTVGATLATAAQHFFKGNAAGNIAQQVHAALQKVSLPVRVATQYPRELSGGELQRIAIARALICQPSLLICDEITSALDVSVQANILELLQSLQHQGLAIIFVTHNLGVVRAIADRVLVLNHGRAVESGLVDALLDQPQQSYTKQLIADSPSLFTDLAA